MGVGNPTSASGTLRSPAHSLAGPPAVRISIWADSPPSSINARVAPSARIISIISGEVGPSGNRSAVSPIPSNRVMAITSSPVESVPTASRVSRCERSTSLLPAQSDVGMRPERLMRVGYDCMASRTLSEKRCLRISSASTSNHLPAVSTINAPARAPAPGRCCSRPRCMTQPHGPSSVNCPAFSANRALIGAFESDHASSPSPSRAMSSESCVRLVPTIATITTTGILFSPTRTRHSPHFTAPSSAFHETFPLIGVPGVAQL